MPHLVFGSVHEHDASFDGFHSNRKTMPAALVTASSQISTPWLRAAAAAMNISQDLSDFVLNDVGIVLADFPNRKMQAFPLEELLRHDPVSLGNQLYMGFRGKPTFLEHDNQEPLKAKGIILDVRLIHIPAYDVWKIHCLCGWDKTKDRAVADAIANNELKTFSMGAWVGRFVCSVCGTEDMVPKRQRCVHMRNIGATFGDRLAYQVCMDPLFFELSGVSQPACCSAAGVLL